MTNIETNDNPMLNGVLDPNPTPAVIDALDNPGQMNQDGSIEPKEKDKKKMTAEEISAIVAEKESTFKKEYEALEESYKERFKEMEKALEDVKLAQMADEDRRAYEAAKIVKAENDAKLALADENHKLKLKIAEIENKQYITAKLQDMPFVDADLRSKFANATKEEFDSFFSGSVVDKLKKLHEYEERDKKSSKNVFFGKEHKTPFNNNNQNDFKKSFLDSILK